MREADRGRVVKPSSRTVAQYFFEWLSAVEPTMDATTWQNWKDYARTYVIPHIGAERLQRLNEPQLLQLYGKLLSEGRVKRDQNSAMYAYWSDQTAKGENPTSREISAACNTTIHAARAAVRRYRSGIAPKETSPGLAPKTVRNIHALIHRALVDAVAWKYIADNPASNVKPPKRPRTRREVWNPDQIRAFLTSVRHDRFAALFLLELTTGIRRGQVCGLKWTSVDLDAGEITVHDNRVVVGGHARYKAGGKTKNADQTIALDKETVAALRTWRDTQDRERDVFGSDYHPVTTSSRSRMAAHHTRTPSGSVSTVSRQRQDYRGSRSTIMPTSVLCRRRRDHACGIRNPACWGRHNQSASRNARSESGAR
jgi:integrase